MREARSASSGGAYGEPFGLHAGGPEDRARREVLGPDRDALASIASTFAFVRTSTPISVRSRRARSERSSENAVSTRGRRLEQHDARLGRIDAPEIPLHRGAADVGNRARQLDAGRSAAHNHEGRVRALPAGIALVLGALEGDQHAAPHLGRLLERLQSRREFLPLGVAEIAVARAARENQIVERDLVPFAEHDPSSRGRRRRHARDGSRRSARP